MSNSVINTLKTAKANSETVARLREGSLNKQIADITEALANPEFPFGPAEMVGVYGKITSVVGRKGAVTFRAHVEEKDGKLMLGEHVETFDVNLPTEDLATEVLAKARLAVDHVLEGNFEAAKDHFEAVARSLNNKGDLSRRVRLGVNRAALANENPWYAPVIEDNYEGSPVEVVVLDPELEDHTLRAKFACEELSELLKDTLSETSTAFQGVENHDLAPEQSLMAHDIIRDARRAIRALEDVDTTNHDEMMSVFEAVHPRAESLVKGLRFLAQLVEGTEGTEK